MNLRSTASAADPVDFAIKSTGVAEPEEPSALTEKHQRPGTDVLVVAKGLHSHAERER